MVLRFKANFPFLSFPLIWVRPRKSNLSGFLSPLCFRLRSAYRQNSIRRVFSRYAKSRLKKLQRGSVKGFIADNKQIKSLGVFDAATQEEIEKLLQIRHLFAHQNGLVDNRFREYFPAANLNDEFRMTLDEFLARVEYLA